MRYLKSTNEQIQKKNAIVLSMERKNTVQFSI